MNEHPLTFIVRHGREIGEGQERSIGASPIVHVHAGDASDVINGGFLEDHFNFSHFPYPSALIKPCNFDTS